MGVFKRKARTALFSSATAMKSMAVIGSLLATIVLICTFGCEGLRPSAPAPQEIEKVAAVKPKEAVSPEVTNAHCILCHLQQPQTIEARGGKHKSDVGCLDCHQEHPPQGTKAIPECSMCHSGEPHYELEQCSSCHSDTHAPLDLKLEGEITGPCLTCHQQQGDEVKDHPSAHTNVACNECHVTHRQIPDCMICHEQHTEDMDSQTCLSCHPVHMPMVITYRQETPSHYCGACHEEASDLLEKNTTKHHDLACAFCHRDTHKMIPPCTACHSNPHGKGMLEKYSKCAQCHGIAHDLKA